MTIENFQIRGGATSENLNAYTPINNGGISGDVDGSAISVNNQGLYPSSLVMTPKSFKFLSSEQPVTLDFSFFFTNITATHRAVTLGLVAKDGDVWDFETQGMYVYASTNDATQKLHIALVSQNFGSTTMGLGEVSLSENSWYRFSVSFKKNAGTAEITSSGILYKTPSANELIEIFDWKDLTLSNTALASSDFVRPSISASTTAGITKLDNIYVSGQPSPYVLIEGTSFNDNLIGTNDADKIFGFGGQDSILGKGGDDTLVGGDSQDALDGGAGSDTADYSEKTAAVSVTLSGSRWADVRVGGVREDRIKNIENITGGAGNDSLIGDQLSNVLKGGAGDDVLNGGAGNDTLSGGLGDDTYTIDNVGDVIIESLGEGTDLIRTTLRQIDLIDYDHIENLTYTGRSGSTLIGNDMSNIIRGGSRNDVIQGGFGSDTLYGGDGTDLLYGFYENYGNDASYGGDIDERLEAERLIPPDVLHGGNGNDIYIGGGDRGNEQQIVELKNEGIDIIFGAYTEYVLPDNVENYCNVMVQIDVSAPYFEIVGNSLNNLIQSAPDWSIMPEQADVDAELQWYLKNFNTNKFLSTVNSNPDIAIERFFGMAGNDTLMSGAGDDYLSGGAGRDRLTGGAGADKFVFDTAPNTRTNADIITDFRSSDGDELVFDDSIFTMLSGGVSVAKLRINTTGRAQDTDDYLILNSNNGKLFYDADGSGRGAAVEIATLTGVSTLSHDDFFII
jgi:serralysin